MNKQILQPASDVLKKEKFDTNSNNIDFRITERFLSNFSGVITFQTFAESKDAKQDKNKLRSLARSTSNPFEKIKNGLSRLNREGAGIYFMVNEGDGKGRKTENVIRLRAFFLDLDNDNNNHNHGNKKPLSLAKDKLRNLVSFVTNHKNPLSVSPNIIVESSPGRYHVYWLLEEEDDSTFPLDRFSSVQKSLARKFGGDYAVHDLPRVMRLPGFMWMKDPSVNNGHGFVSRILEGEELEAFGGDITRPKAYAGQEFVSAMFGNDDITTTSSPSPSSRSKSKIQEREIPTFGEGERDNGLFKYACKLRAGGLGEEEIRQLVTVAAARCNPPFSSEETEAKIRQACRYKPGTENAVVKEEAKDKAREEEIERGISLERISLEEINDDSENPKEIIEKAQEQNCSQIEDDSVFGTMQRLFGESLATKNPLAYHREKNSWTDTGAAKFFVERYGKVIRITEDDRLWLWDGKKWSVDIGEDICRHKVASLAPIYVKMARAYLVKGNEITQKSATGANASSKGGGRQKDSREFKKDADKCLAFAQELGNSARQTSVLRAVRGVVGVRGKVEDFDAQPNIINLQNGVLNLDTWGLLPHSDPRCPAMLCAKIARVSWNPEAISPIFDRFVYDIMLGDKELIGYKFRQWGYVISGYTNQRALFFHYGEGGNGKTKEVDILAWILGDYARELPASVYLDGGFESERNYALSEFPGVRMAHSGEAGGDRAWDEEVMKLLTGDEGVLRARAIRQAPICFKPRFKPILHANNRPRIKTGGAAFWSRLHLIPYNFKADDSNRDENILEKMQLEADGIFLRLASGYKEFRAAGGLRPPTGVIEEREAYKENELDDLNDFVAQRCEISAAYCCYFSDLYKDYSDFCRQNGSKPRSKDSMASFLSSMGFVSFFGSKKKAKRQGIKLKEEVDFSFEN